MEMDFVAALGGVATVVFWGFVGFIGLNMLVAMGASVPWAVLMFVAEHPDPTVEQRRIGLERRLSVVMSTSALAGGIACVLFLVSYIGWHWLRV